MLLKVQSFSCTWWLMPIIPATQEVEIMRIAIPGQPGPKVRPHLNQCKKKKKSFCNPNYARGVPQAKTQEK
jgi:hypothetical protein